jgi:hypothetical protein
MCYKVFEFGLCDTLLGLVIAPLKTMLQGIDHFLERAIFGIRRISNVFGNPNTG